MTKEWKHPNKKPSARLFVGLLEKPGNAPILVCAYDQADGAKLRVLDSITPANEQELFKSVAHALVAPIIQSRSRFYLQNGGRHSDSEFGMLSGNQLALLYQDLEHFRRTMVS